MCDVLYSLGNTPPTTSIPESSNDFSSDARQSVFDANADLQPKPITIYLSSSMFRELKPDGLSSNTQDAKVFFYPGSTSGQMLEKFKNDPKASQIILVWWKNSLYLQELIISMAL